MKCPKCNEEIGAAVADEAGRATSAAVKRWVTVEGSCVTCGCLVVIVTLCVGVLMALGAFLSTHW